MGSDQINNPLEPLAMNGGDGRYSYSQNSTVQKRGIECVKDLITEGIVQKLDTQRFLSPISQKKIFIADLGCAMGPNTFIAVQNIIDSVKQRFQSDGIDSGSTEFHVFFNDHVVNDFNTLFISMPSDKEYFAAGVPGSFQNRLFPKASLDVIHSSYSLQWLSKLPNELTDKQSPAWNKGKVYYPTSAKAVVEAYRGQFRKDMESFLSCRALEIVSGGLMALLIPSVPDPHCKCVITSVFDLLGSALMDLAGQGLVDEDKVDNFNLPIYIPTPDEIVSLIENNGDFIIEKMDPLLAHQVTDPDTMAMHLRAGMESNIRENFGAEIVEQVFDKFKEKIAESKVLIDPIYKRTYGLFVLLKRKPY
ncbi:loganic acid O-methyltransferase-like [Mangifera indica]|uniref:loganic acid O-methyltransferase-like n=1 Tax=Mangifera indica TaxID=29780 RepID=UPI001CFA5B0B|nr:loganic acid O-methyltransferase-like [Mangifera indica]